MEKVEYRTGVSQVIELDDIDSLAQVPDWADIIWLRVSGGIFNENFFFPPKLAEVYITRCTGTHRLPKLPDSIRFVSITYSYLSNSAVLFGPEQTQIETVDLSYNQIQEFPTNLPDNLISIDLSNNSISKLPVIKSIGNNLLHVNLSYNNLTDLPGWLLDLNEETRLTLMPNKFWFNAYSNISLNREIYDYHIKIANRFFSTSLGAKLIHTRMISNNQVERDTDNELRPVIFNVDAYYPLVLRPALAPPAYNPINPVMPNPANHYTPTTKTTAEQAQNVHNSDIQDSFSKSVEKIMENSAPAIPDYMNKIWWYYLFDGINIRANLAFINLVKSNCNIPSVVSRNGVTYGEILERIWAISEIHEYKKAIREVLRDEIMAGRTVCFTGKVTRLVNTLSGFVDDVQIGISENEQINNAVIACMRRCEANPELDVRDEVKKALDELAVPEDRQAIWLDAL